jgi:hypothetical protein
LITLAMHVHEREARAQLQFTEVMYEPGGDDGLWEWVEIRNTSAAAVDLNGWVFDDDDDSTINAMAGANIRAVNGNTIVPAGGVAVLYPGDELDFMPTRFTDAWGVGTNLIAVDGFTSLTGTDAIGLWPSYAAYAADTIPMVTTSPRRTFAGAAATLSYATGFPAASNKRSIAWDGTGSPSDGMQWVESEPGVGGGLGPYHEVTSIQTTIPFAPINDTADRGNPGVRPAGPAAAGLLITEIMFAPASPTATAGWTSNDFEWVEIYNNTAAAINFGATPHVFDDFVGALAEPNIESGTLAVGEVGILYNAEMLTPDHMATMWGAGKNYIPVSVWPALNNSGGDTIAIWDSIGDYGSEAIDGSGHRTHALATAAVVYDTATIEGWPSQTTGRSIFLNNLSADPNVGMSWTKAGTAADTLGSVNAAQLSEMTVDHPGGDVGSPGYAPGSVATSLLGDYNGNFVIDAADYTVWRNSLGGGSLLNDATPGTVDVADYNYWKMHFGQSGAGSGEISAVPEPTGMALLFVAAMVQSLCRRGRMGVSLVQDGRTTWR